MIIYEPSGKAREYSPLAANFYNGCDHGCKYCYAPCIRHTSREKFLSVVPRTDIVNQFEHDAIKNYGSKKQVLFNFMGDPYCEANDKYKITRKCLEISLKYKIPIAILTKGGKRCLKDINIFKQFGVHIMVGATLTFLDNKKSKEWEPGAANPEERLETLKKLHDNGIKTWASLEPVIEPYESFELIKKSIEFVDKYKIGKINNYNGIDKTIDWYTFLENVILFLRKNRKDFYIKNDLAKYANDITFINHERDADYFCVS